MKDNDLKQVILELKSEMNSRFTLLEKSISEMRKESQKDKTTRENRSQKSATIYDLVSKQINSNGGNLDGRK